MTDGKVERSDDVDACPFPPDREPPKGSFGNNLYNYYGEFFGNLKVVLSIISIAGLILGYSLLSVSPALISTLVDPDSWGRSIPDYEYFLGNYDGGTPEYGNRTLYVETIILEGDEVRVFENCTVILSGQIMVRDNAKLILRDTLIVANNTVRDLSFPFFLHVFFNDSTVLECYNSTIYSLRGTFDIVFFGESKGTFSSSNLTNVKISGDENSSVDLTDSSLYRLQVAGNSGLKLVNSKVKFLGPYSHRQRRDQIEQREQRYLIEQGLLPDQPETIPVDYYEDCSADVRNSTIHTVVVSVSDFSSLNLSKQMNGYHSSFNLNRDLGVDGWIYNLTLHDSKITGGWFVDAHNGDVFLENSDNIDSLSISDGELHISNCTLHFLHCKNGSSTDMENSILSDIFSDGDANLRIARSNIRGLYGGLLLDDFSGRITLEKVLVNSFRGTDINEAYMQGSVKFLNNPRKANFDVSSLTRNFEVKMFGETRMLPNVELILFDQENEPVWTDTTDRDGSAFFNITFREKWRPPGTYDYITNYDEEWRLEASWKDIRENVTVSMLSETPISIHFEEVPESPIWEMKGYLIPISSSIIVITAVGYLSQRIRK